MVGNRRRFDLTAASKFRLANAKCSVLELQATSDQEHQLKTVSLRAARRETLLLIDLIDFLSQKCAFFIESLNHSYSTKAILE